MKRIKLLSLAFFVFLSSGISLLAQQPFDVQHYRFEIALADNSDAINGKATITVTFNSPASQVIFDLASVDNDKGMQAFMVTDVQDGLPLSFYHKEDRLVIDLKRVAQKGERRIFEIQYMGIPKDGLIIAQNKYGDRTFFADNWPNRAHEWIPCIDRPDDKASVEFLVTAPKQYKVIANGDQIMQKEDVAMNEQLAASGRTFWHWKEEVPVPTKVIVIGVARFAVKEFKESPPGIPITAWVYPQDSLKGFYDYGVAPGIVQFFSEYIAPFPYHKLANVQSKTIFGGMENASAIFYAEQSVTGNRKWEDVIAHEIAHQWFGDMVTEKSFAHLWLSEGFATYLTHIYMENKYGKDSMISRLKADRQTVIDFLKKSDHAVVDSSSDLMSLLNANSYQKGGWVLHMLRNEVGDTTFRKIIRAYYRQYKAGNAETSDFESIAEKVSGRALKWFFDQWLYWSGIPELDIKTKTAEDELKIKITQGKKLFRLMLEVAIVGKDGSSTVHRIEIRNKETEYKVKGKGAMRVIIDPEAKLLFRGK